VLVTNLPLCQGRLHTIHQERCSHSALALSGRWSLYTTAGSSCSRAGSTCINSRDSNPGLCDRVSVPGLLAREELTAVSSSVCLRRNLNFRPDIKGDYPPNLSILISGGKENNCDSLSNGEWNGNSPSPNCWSSRPCGMWRLEGSLPRLSTLRMNKPEIQNTSLQYEHWSQLRFNSIFLYCFFIIISALKTPIIWSFIFFLLFYSFLRYFDFSYVFIFYSTTDLNRIRIKRY